MKHCKDCGDKIGDKIEVRVRDMGHDINIEDTVHSDNFITITKDEAEYVLKRLLKILPQKPSL